MSCNEMVVDIQDLKVHFKGKSNLFKRSSGNVKAIDGVSIQINNREVIGLVGESGSGKTTLGRALIRLNEITAGKILFMGQDITRFNNHEMHSIRQKIQFIFQDPNSALNPRMTILQSLLEPLNINKAGTKAERVERAEWLLSLMKLPSEMGLRYPHQLSGGQKQRIVIARALALNPNFIIADEPVSALDVSVQAQILNLMVDLKEKLQLTMLFISHDLAVVQHISDRIAVMYLGHIVELADSHELFKNPCHPYTKALMESVPSYDITKKLHIAPLKGEIPSPVNPPSGCVFRTRCPNVCEDCAKVPQILRNLGGEHSVACMKITG